MPRIRAIFVSATVLAALVTAGCEGGEKASTPSPAMPSTTSSVSPAPYETGIGKLSAAQILARAKAALKAADSVHVKGSTAADDGSAVNLDLALTRTSGRAVIVTPDMRVTVVVIGGSAYLQGDDAFWSAGADDARQGEAYAAMFRDKWLKTTVGDKRFGDFSDVAVKSRFAAALSASGSLRKIGARVVDGFNCIGLQDDESVLWIEQVSGRPVRVAGSDGETDLAFTEYNRVIPPTAPPAGMVVEAGALR
jgi:hypothetical protein